MKFMPALRTTAVAAVLGASGLANAATLVTNGSFEDAGISSGSWAILDSIPGWSGTNGIEVRSNAVGSAQDGNNFAELDTKSNSSIFQTISTVLGQVYDLTFWYSPRIGQPATTNGIEAWWGNTLLTTPAITASGIGSTSNNWTSYTFSVVGTGSDVLKFSAVGTSDTFGGNIDNVSLSAVPLPGAALLFGSALLGFMGFSNRRKV